MLVDVCGLHDAAIAPTVGRLLGEPCAAEGRGGQALIGPNASLVDAVTVRLLRRATGRRPGVVTGSMRGGGAHR